MGLKCNRNSMILPHTIQCVYVTDLLSQDWNKKVRKNVEKRETVR